jgi:UDP-N-acetylglucosamine 2-epimerase (non-hydrolysing)
MPTVINVVGARPQFIKAGPVSKALVQADVQEILLHTGQHYDDLMSSRIMLDVGLRQPDINLGVGSGSHGAQTARMLEGIEQAIMDTRPDAVLIYGDTNSTVAAALAATKLGVYTAHVEAGLRSFNRAMPEELNRVVTDHLSDLLLAPTDVAMERLHAEGLSARAELTGDVMVDTLRSIDFDDVSLPKWANGDFYCATIHRAENTDGPERLAMIFDSLASLNHPVHLLAHPRLRQRIDDHGLARPEGSLVLHDPLPYAEMLASVRASKGLLTDSGGLQKEAFILRVPCVTLRSETEWPETMVGGWNVLAAGDHLELGSLVVRQPNPVAAAPFGDGKAAERIVAKTLDRIR